MIAQLASLLQTAKRTIVFTGAGMSTESGLPDFRSKERGLWTAFNPDELANVNAIEVNQTAFTSFYQHRLREIDQYKPHEGHHILGDWEKRQLIQGIITQNVDGFHHVAGNKNVMELHGTFNYLYCHSCHHKVTQQEFINGKTFCDCGGIIRPAIVLFGEMLPEKTFQKAEKEAEAADLFIVLGSSLTVTPANIFPLIAKENGANLVIINREPTPYDKYADLLIQNLNIKEALIQLHTSLASTKS